jgi:23S rRNA (cytosine1962-C5)-methyltransferase
VTDIPAFLRDIPPPSAKRLAVRVTPDAVRQIRGGHPWVFESSVVSVSGVGTPGDLAVVFDAKRAFVAVGLYDPASVIRIKILHYGQPATIDERWWAARFGAADEHRAPLIASGDTTGYRLVHGENDAMPGLVLDRYGSTLVLKLYSAAWLAHLATLLPVIAERWHPSSVILRLARNVAGHETFGLIEGIAVYGEAPDEPVRFRENGLLFEADVANGQKTGYFLDQRDNRALVRSMSKGLRVLDVFSGTGGFSVHAAAGGARSVHSVDLSSHAIDAVARNFRLNEDIEPVRSVRHGATVGDAFRAMDQLHQWGEQFDLVIVDPPSFAPRRDNVDMALRAYRKLTDLALCLMGPGGILMQSSCSSRITADQFHDGIDEAAAARGIRLDDVARTGHAIDHPIAFVHGAYLKARFARLPG